MPTLSSRTRTSPPGRAHQVAVEAFGQTVPVELLAGSWRLLYTTAVDVVGLLELERQTLGLAQCGEIYQAFTADGKVTVTSPPSGSLPLCQPGLGFPQMGGSFVPPP